MKSKSFILGKISIFFLLLNFGVNKEQTRNMQRESNYVLSSQEPIIILGCSTCRGKGERLQFEPRSLQRLKLPQTVIFMQSGNGTRDQ